MAISRMTSVLSTSSFLCLRYWSKQPTSESITGIRTSLPQLEHIENGYKKRTSLPQLLNILRMGIKKDFSSPTSEHIENGYKKRTSLPQLLNILLRMDIKKDFSSPTSEYIENGYKKRTSPPTSEHIEKYLCLLNKVS